MVAFSYRPETGQDHAMTITQLTTAHELEAMGSDARFELDQGVLQHMSPSGARSSMVSSNIGYELRHYVQTHRLGAVIFSEAGFVLEHDPDTVVAPDVAFVRRDRMPDLIPERGFFLLAPDLAVEVISPTDEPGDMRRKQAIYDRVAIPMVWWIDPLRRTAAVHVSGEPVRHLTESEILDGERVVPGFSIPLATIFDV
jgi:Uma2 family endonuclease